MSMYDKVTHTYTHTLTHAQHRCILEAAGEGTGQVSVGHTHTRAYAYASLLSAPLQHLLCAWLISQVLTC